ncbi:PEPxxWA-CTERM sorting domain-containing protein [Phenylobacterium sp.]|uniref:PEPxxWA-CTERM sorting domain-containing protein n=1 Tax=Phenylobacterium sp. TaxID=1871053 RepID=UPI002600E468|nr:PEPxxWA-CTERM sorting domain-containing protein [Phenylobacterium sp.]
MRIARLLCAAALAATAIAGPAAAAATLVHAYDFKTGNGGLVLDSVGGANGQLLNGASVAGSALVLDGLDDYVQFGAKIVDTAGPFSVYLRAEFQPDLQGITELISQGFSGGPGFYIGEDGAGGFRLGDYVAPSGLGVPAVGGFHDLLLTFGAGALSFSIDNATPFTTAFGGFTTGGVDTRLGHQFCCAEYFHGRLDTLKTFDGVATYAEATGAGGGVPEPQAWAMMILGFFGAGVLLRRRPGPGAIARAPA